MRVLAISALPGYAEVMCGGSLAKFMEEKHEVFIAHVTWGAKESQGGASTKKESINQEALDAANVIGAECLFGGLPYLEIYDNRGCRDAVMDMIRTAKPDVILSPSPTSHHVDQRKVSELVFNAAYCSTIPNYPSPSGLEPSQTRAPIFYMDNMNGVNFMPEEYVDISDFWRQKVQMINCYKSLQWVNEYTEANLLEMTETLSRVRGIQVQVEHSECFRREHAWGRIRAERLLP